jgi:hypothetical protein
MIRCKLCRDTGWVCSTHQTKPYSGTRSCGCGASEMPCPECTREDGWDKAPKTSVASMRNGLPRK